MSVVNCDNIYTSCVCNCYPNCIDFYSEQLIFASTNSLVLYDLKLRKVLSVFHHHSDKVNSIRWVRDGKCNHFVSSSYDKTSVIWHQVTAGNFVPKHILKGHIDSVIISDSLIVNHSEEKLFLTATSSNDKSFRIWKNENLCFTENSNFFIFDIKLYNHLIIPGLIVLCAGSDELVKIKRFDLQNNQLECLISLSGHSDWIRTVDLYSNVDGTLMLASGSQDFIIRVYHIKPLFESDVVHQQTFTLKCEDERKFIVNLDTVLSGHENSITEVKWCQMNEQLYLLTSSMDKTIVVWEQMGSKYDSVWNEKWRFGEVGDNAIGFLGCTSISSLGLIMGYSFNGAVHFWKKDETTNKWLPFYSITGHFNEVTDLCWEPNGKYFLTCSVDKTTRLHSSWTNDGVTSWHEISRPQIHGYDMKCISMVNRLRFVSGADEKVIRIFDATKNFINSIRTISSVDFDDSILIEKYAECASVPALGLSNSAVYDVTQSGDENRKPKENTLPTEEYLLQNTLWWESQKLYGHGYEVFDVEVNHKGTLLASVCKATNALHASIIVWDIQTYKKLAQLTSHNLTITQLRFSPNDSYLLSVSRDRTWSLFNMEEESFSKIASSDKKTSVHSRIIWDCAWTPSSEAFLTASRDKSLIIWYFDLNQNLENCLGNINHTDPVMFDDSITSVDIHNEMNFKNQFIACIALDNGKLSLMSFSIDGCWSLLYSFEAFRHSHTINRVRFSPKAHHDQANENIKRIHLATVGNDRTAKLFQIDLIV